jgi:hypothetical protein
MGNTSNILDEELKKLNDLEKLFYKPPKSFNRHNQIIALKELYKDELLSDLIYKDELLSDLIYKANPMLAKVDKNLKK